MSDLRKTTSDLAVASALAGLLPLVVYVLQAAGTTYLLDSSELVATTVALGVSHPPGHPSFHALAWPWTLLPIGTAAFRLHLACGFATALACALLPVALHRAGALRERADLVVAVSSAWLAGLSSALLFQSVRAEVYSLHLLLAAAITTLVVRRDGPAPREVWLAGTLFGVALLNHHYLALFLLAPVAVWVWVVRRQDRLAAVGAATVSGTWMMAGWLWLLARGHAAPLVGWSEPRDAEGLWWLVSAQAFQKTAARAVSIDPMAGIGNVVGVMIEQLSPLGVVLSLVAFALLLVRARALAALLGAACAMNLLTQVLFDFDPWNPDVLGYFMSTVWWACLLAAAGAGLVLQRTAAKWGVAAALLLSIPIGAAMAPADLRSRSLADAWQSETLRDEAYRGLGPDGLVITAYFETAFNIWYARAVEDRRPDVLQHHRSFRTYPGWDALMREKHPALGPVLDDTPEKASLAPAGLRAFAARGGVRIDPDPTLTSPDEALASTPDGLMLHLTSRTAPPPAQATSDGAARLAALAANLDGELQSRRNLLWAAYGVAHALCTVGRGPEAFPWIRLATALAPEDVELRAMLDRCGADIPAGAGR